MTEFSTTYEALAPKKVALVTGASRGIGRAIALELAKAGFSLCLAARDSQSLAETQQAATALSGKPAAAIIADLKKPDAPHRCIEFALGQFGQLDLLVNCAGATRRGEFLDFTLEDWLDGFALKFHASVLLCQAAWPHLASRSGSIINIIGSSSRTPSADFTIGGAVNSALLNLTKALADKGSRDGVRVNAVNPGYIKSGRLYARIESLMKERQLSESAAEEELLTAYQIGHFGTPEDVAQLVAFLASDQSAYIQGATIDIDGGATRGI
ncbi:SDR family oxidoreductase [Mesorhizobium sp. M2A.F.Ca.ET.039.01.1.1]|uniref:SDR family oxidoreductase n=1 Tax=Mesorhizobium sp. M2A.F.Ca.ET.039.01.1.1 TaxID=2496746 RepID=UPI000FCA1339|nr:SDR family oxidoreductase [Mesorhizobium sp. M2A.F.Ca.ET.039.01.1.1]RWX72330.1 SDR family oxidoreductase [Mesorhizobium sp. M2A.F.Ca.ET.039.01.1.1]